MNYEKLLFRRQFFLTYEKCHQLEHWQHITFSSFHLYAHPDVELTLISDKIQKSNFALVGYMIDPNHPEQSNSEILMYMQKSLKSIDAIIEFLNDISGRFVLIINNESDTCLFHDPCGLRSVYYTNHNGKYYIGSQPYIFKFVMPLKYGKNFADYNNSNYKKNTLEHWIPSGCSLFDDIYHLVPNHYLQVKSGEQIRYWPAKKLKLKNINEVVVEVSTLLNNLIEAAGKRFPLSLSLTAGFDSRVLLSASKNIAESIHYYTLKYRNLSVNAPDIKIPKKLLSHLGLQHEVIDCHSKTDPNFAEIYENNVSIAHYNDWGIIAFGILNSYDTRRIAIKGNVSEVCRCFYYKNGKHPLISSASQLLKLEKLWRDIPFINEQISDWYDQVKSIISISEYKLLDIFYWEHRMGSWQAQSQLEWDIVQEVFTPFNHRGLLELMLSVPTSFRCAPDYLFYKSICEHLWPDVLEMPINPPITLKNRLKCELQRLGL